MIRKIARSILTILLIGSLGFSTFNLYVLWRNPTVTRLVERAKDDIVVRIEKHLSTRVTLESIEARLAELLDEQPRNWLVIEAIEEIAFDQRITIGSDLQEKHKVAYDEDHGFIVGSVNCAACAWDPTACDLSAVLLLCRAPIDLTPIGDVVGVVRESKHYVFKEKVDMFEFGLSAVGLGAVVLVPLTGGTSATVKVGTSVAKTAKRMGRISPKLLLLMNRKFKKAIKWDIIAKSSFGNYTADIRRAVDPKAIRPVMTIIDKLGSIRNSVGISDTLHLMKYIDKPKDARAIAGAADAMRSRTVGVFETLGKNRVFRSVIRYSDEFIGFIKGIVGMLIALLGLFGSFLGSLIIRVLRFLAKPKALSR